jgi:hypothetical protein
MGQPVKRPHLEMLKLSIPANHRPQRPLGPDANPTKG